MPKYNPFFQKLEKPQSKIFIYGLIDPDTKQLKYVGQTIQGFRRIHEHYGKCLKRNKKTNQLSYSNLWIKKLKENNKIFDIIYLEYCKEEELNEKECFYIDYFKSIGCELLNQYSGGQIRDEQTRRKISERTKKALDTPEFKEFFRQNAYKNIAGYNKGKKYSREFKDKIRQAQMYRTWKFEIDGEIYYSVKKIAEKLKVSSKTVSRYLNGTYPSIKGKTYKHWKYDANKC